MADSQHEDGARIFVEDYFDLRAWAKEFDTTAGDVRRAVRAVGNRAADVEAYLRHANALPAPGAREETSASRATQSALELSSRKHAHS